MSDFWLFLIDDRASCFDKPQTSITPQLSSAWWEMLLRSRLLPCGSHPTLLYETAVAVVRAASSLLTQNTHQMYPSQQSSRGSRPRHSLQFSMLHVFPLLRLLTKSHYSGECVRMAHEYRKASEINTAETASTANGFSASSLASWSESDSVMLLPAETPDMTRMHGSTDMNMHYGCQ